MAYRPPSTESIGPGQCQHSRAALDEVHNELVDGPPTEPAVAVRGYGPGRLVVGLAGPVDRATADRFAVLLRELHHLAARELVLTFGLVTWCDRRLSRAVIHARMAHLVDGGRVELHDVPAGLLVDLDLGASPGAARATAYTVGHDGPRGSPDLAG